MQKVIEDGCGVILLIGGELSRSQMLENQLEMMFDEIEQPKAVNYSTMEIGTGAQILRDLGVRQMRIMGAPLKYPALTGFDLEIVEYINNQ